MPQSNSTSRNETSEERQLTLFTEGSPPILSGIDDMNLLEILIGLPGRRRPQEGKTISVPWERGDRSYYIQYDKDSLTVEWDSRGRQPKASTKGKEKQPERTFSVEVKVPRDIGLPGQEAEDVLIALMKLSAEQSFTTPVIETTRYKLLDMMKWHKGGHYYNRLDNVLSQLVHLTVETNALWSPETETYFKSSFNILDSADLETEGKQSSGKIHIQWGSKLMQVFESGYMKRLDTQFFYSLGNPNTKRIYRWLDKHLTFSPVTEVDVLRFAHKVLGYGVSYRYPSQIIQKLRPHFDELYERGFCRMEVEPSSSDSGKKFVFTRVSTYKSVTYPRRDLVVEALRTRGVQGSAEHLVDRYSWERCLRQIEYHDFKGKSIEDSGAWLRSAIEENYQLPDKLKTLIERAKDETARWCDRMYESLSEKEKEKIQERVARQLPAHTQQDEQARLRKRNQLLLERKRVL